ncbi:MAG TPA: amylo-alpha-1,6-glucosidase [Flavipsychrobacter sp.]|nr:amylo-alpha-1,6-glucosidase [Flavipsychrobacter sp.]
MTHDIIQVENKYYISVNSTYADDRTKVLNHIDTFGIFDRQGDIKQMGEEVQGIYHNGMRFISDLDFRINNNRPLLLSSSIKEENEILSVDLTNPVMQNTNSDTPIPKGVIYIGRSKFVRNGACYEQIKFFNYGNEPVEFNATISVNADFKDIFEIRGIKREKRGEIYEVKHANGNKIIISYLGLDKVKRFTEITFNPKPSEWEQHNKAKFKISLAPQQYKLIDYTLQFLTDKDEGVEKLDYIVARQKLEAELTETDKIITQISTSNPQFDQWITRSEFDILSLLADTPYGKYPYAGVPWYNTAFGRDGIITALETLWAAPDIAHDVLVFLANNQATEISAQQDAEPGKIVHEMREGEMVDLGEIPFKKYYGSVDATPLFLVLAGAYYRRTADIKTIQEIWPHIEAALNWIDKYGDIDNDGFVDYSHKSVNGLINQGWKDSFDSISDEHGNLATPPISLCEVQGYVYDAKIQIAKLATVLGYNNTADRLSKEAADLKKRFNKQFWDEKLQCYVIALDGDKKPCRITASNAGHCLFSGIADEDKAVKVSKTLLSEDMYSGWGVRTLSRKEVRYNPMSYHNGSVWPHDVAIIAKGFSRYGLDSETLQLAKGLFDSSLFIELQRLPELFCGFERRRGEGPTDYPVACSPQAWSVAAVYLLLDACLRIDIDAEAKKVYFNKPVLPESLDTITINHLKLGDGYASIQLFCERNSVGVKVKSCPEGWQILLATEQVPADKPIAV